MKIDRVHNSSNRPKHPTVAAEASNGSGRSRNDIVVNVNIDSRSIFAKVLIFSSSFLRLNLKLAAENAHVKTVEAWQRRAKLLFNISRYCINSHFNVVAFYWSLSLHRFVDMKMKLKISMTIRVSPDVTEKCYANDWIQIEISRKYFFFSFPTENFRMVWRMHLFFTWYRLRKSPHFSLQLTEW